MRVVARIAVMGLVFGMLSFAAPARAQDFGDDLRHCAGVVHEPAPNGEGFSHIRVFVAMDLPGRTPIDGGFSGAGASDRQRMKLGNDRLVFFFFPITQFGDYSYAVQGGSLSTQGNIQVTSDEIPCTKQMVVQMARNAGILGGAGRPSPTASGGPSPSETLPAEDPEELDEEDLADDSDGDGWWIVWTVIAIAGVGIFVVGYIVRGPPPVEYDESGHPYYPDDGNGGPDDGNGRPDDGNGGGPYRGPREKIIDDDPPKRGPDEDYTQPVMMVADPVASVIVPAYLAADTIVACLTGLRGQDLDEAFEVIVVASGDHATADIVRRAFPRVRLLWSPERLTPGAARNAGIAAARGDVIVFLAADCVPEPDWLRLRVAAHRAGHRLVAGFVDAAEPSSIAGWAQYFVKFAGVQALEGATFTARAPGLFHLSYAREVFVSFGPFPSGTVAGEDTAYNMALVRAGHAVHFDHHIRVRHINALEFKDVIEGQREQGRHAGAAMRAIAAEPWNTGSFASLKVILRTFIAVARHRPGLLRRFVTAAPFALIAYRARRLEFQAAFTGEESVTSAASGEVMEISPRPTIRPRITAVVAAYNEERVIGRCLDSLLRQSVEELEIIVADDGSNDRTVEIAASRGVPVACLPHAGPARARNIGAQMARGDVVVFVDADLELERHCLERLAAPILSGGTTGTFTKEIWVGNADERLPSFWTINRGMPAGHVFPARFPDTWSNYRAVDRVAFLRAGGFDDVGYGEDMTLAAKLGGPAVAVPGAVMWHHNPDTLGEVWENARWMGRGVRIRERHRPWRHYLPWRSLRNALHAPVPPRQRAGFLVFKTVYDAGILSSYVRARLLPGSHAK